jgi:hypothetical protein
VILEGCKIISHEEDRSFEVAHPQLRRVHYPIQHPDEMTHEIPSKLRLRSDNLLEMQEWIKVIEQAMNSTTHYPIMLPRYQNFATLNKFTFKKISTPK